jgi:hypothetical protein
MTVKREARLNLPQRPEDIESAIQRVLDAYPEYHRVRQTGTRWITRVRPTGWPLVLSTMLRVTVGAETPSMATVHVQTRSQPFVFADVFGQYDKYLSTFESRLRFELEGTGPTSET